MAGKPTVLVSSAYAGVTDEWFDASFWGDSAVPVSSGGRGSAWFIHSNQGELVLRHYRRGGLVARISGTKYFYTGAENVRAVAEFKLLGRLHAEGLPVPAPVAACYWRSGVFYQAAILTERVRPATTFGALWKDWPASVWEKVGRTIRQFHDHGVFHADLNCFNILIHDASPYLIDFDKGKYLPKLGRVERWKRANLARLYKSLAKELRSEHDRHSLDDLWKVLVRGYETGF
ncbi:3-deoxy-D-manno-octulosonic acid kinase [Marinobacter sp.]|uniref:3-deoxy-D-manno-octulosonic acid kinase n=1 Tax=Marinobacter sp. TaxID=50741 RepID=UPI0035638392